jgi:ADP-ribosyl-[dinitrogen reductase] hydrolase
MIGKGVMRDRIDILAGTILGTAVGDSIGLPREGLSSRRARALWGDPPLRQRLVFGWGMTSDDTEHTCLLAQALLRQPEDPDRFARALAWGLRGWLLGAPAGIGKATLMSCLKLCLGFPPGKSGVWSAGNGPAMRSALLGVCLGADPERLRSFVRVATRLTHTDPRAERGALLVALAAHHGSVRGPDEINAEEFFSQVGAALPDIDPTLAGLLQEMKEYWRRRAPLDELAGALGQGRGVSGYIYHTVPLAVYSWLLHPGDLRRAVEEVVCLGGDSDTTGAITGAIAGATVGASAIPEEWLALLEWPRSVSWMRAMAGRLAETFPITGPSARPGPLRLFWPGLPLRNLFFLAVVLGHLLRRALPPYRPG